MRGRACFNGFFPPSILLVKGNKILQAAHKDWCPHPNADLPTSCAVNPHWAPLVDRWEVNRCVMHILCTLITESKRNCLACQFMRKRKNVPLESTSEHTFYLSQTPQTCLCKKKLPGVNFYRFNAKNWHFRQILRKKVAFFFLQI